MLSFELTDDRTAIQIYCDSEGAGVLLETLGRLVRERGGHSHLRGPSAGGNDLDEASPFGTKALGEVIIDYAEGNSLEAP